MPDSSSSSTKLRIAASVTLIVGVMLGAVQLFRALGPGADHMTLVMEGLIVAAAFAGMSVVLQGIATVLEKNNVSVESVQQPVQQSNEVVVSLLEQIRVSVEMLPEKLANHSAVNDETHVTPAAPVPVEITQALRRMTAMLEEIREAATMDESQRQTVQKERREQRRIATIAEAETAIANVQLGKAGKLIAQVEADFPQDASLADLKAKLAAQRQAAPVESIEKIKAQVEDLMAISSWEEAHQMAAQFAEDFPDNPDSAALLWRVTRERDLFNESTAQQLFDEIKTDLDRKRWRRALAGAQRLLNRFPEHRHAAKVRAQLKTIQGNAEIEERHEQEMRIQELLRAQRIGDAIALAEDLLARFPNSPQAATLEELLPKMRERAGNSA